MIRKTTFINPITFKKIDKYDIRHDNGYLSIEDDKSIGEKVSIARLLEEAKNIGITTFLPLPKIRPSDEIYPIPEEYFNQ